jgi:GT2 family glycosyltransferase
MSAAPLDLSVLVVTHRNPGLTRDCLASVFAETRDLDFEVIVVDNASSDGTPEMVEREFPAVRLIRSERNLGFAAASNRAAAAARGRHLVLLNPDTIVLDRALERLLDFARAQAQPGIFGGRTLRPDGRLDPSSCWGEQTPWSAFCFATGLSTALRGSPRFDPESLGRWARDSVRDVGVVTGCLLLCERSTWTALQGFDERFFMYGEDADLSHRARRRGLPVRVCPEATIVHVVGASSPVSGRKMTMVMCGRATLMRKHWSAVPRAFGLVCLQAGVLLRAAVAQLPGAPVPRFWAGVWTARRDWRAGYPPLSRSSAGRPAAAGRSEGRHPDRSSRS